jgi:ribosomal protein S12 methylthiotransferase accessory factor
MGAMGITRIADITGLDTIGMPVVTACRPNARSLAIAQGKGLDVAAATASALLESVESFHAEHCLLPVKLASYRELRAGHPVVAVDGLPRTSASTFHPDRPTLWIEGIDLVGGGPLWVPFEMVHTNFSLPLPTGSGSFMMTSNGLASGNHLLEAISHGICEVVERDANALWSLRGGAGQTGNRIDPATIDDPDCRIMLAKLDAAGIRYGLWDTTSDIGLPCFLCIIADQRPNYFRQMYSTHGSGCHPVREIALMRALTEAAQTRLTCIAGARDDGSRDFFERARNPDRVARTRAQLELPGGPLKSFAEVPTRWNDTFDEDVAWQLERLEAVGIHQAAVVDLSKPEFGIPVVRVIVPGLESLHDAPGYVLGGRGRAILRDRGGA